jgi:hypothetical protein
MTARMVRINDGYITAFDEMVATFKENIEIVDDSNLKLDPYFYERKASLDRTIKAIDDGTMNMYDFNESIDTLISQKLPEIGKNNQ